MEAALATFSALREWNLALVRSFSAADLAKPVNHPERGDMTLQTIVETMDGHDRNHLKQVERDRGLTGENQSTARLSLRNAFNRSPSGLPPAQAAVSCSRRHAVR